MPLDFDTFFHAATGNTPYDYQRRLACGEPRRTAGAARSEISDSASQMHTEPAACVSRLIDIPTGLGKTAAVVMAWLWNRIGASSQISDRPSEMRGLTAPWPRRLVYCLPMRTLVEQTQDNVQLWILRLALAATESGSSERSLIDAEIQRHAASVETDQERQRWIASVHAPWGKDGRTVEGAFAPTLNHSRPDIMWLAVHSPVVLMGGEELDDARRDWDIHPERPAILIGTQDMLLSRALNRGYGMSRYRWPMHFGLLNNDALWVMDETQLMGVSVETSAQLDGFRSMWPVQARCPTWWMSATLDQARLATVDHLLPANGWPVEKLSLEEKTAGRPHELFTARKTLSPAPLALSAATKTTYPKQLAVFITDPATDPRWRHQPDTLTLVVVNRVSRAQGIFAALTDKKNPLYDRDRVALIHSRFRRVDRKRHEQLLFGRGDRIVVATQAIEAGVDVSARLLVTELAPWSSLVQRIGRCSRRAEPGGGEVLWVDIEPDAKGELLLPYSGDEIAQAQHAVRELSDVSPRSLSEVSAPEKPVIRPVVRRRDLVDLFDTTPDLCGQDLDISRYIRDEQDNDAQFFWRAVDGDAPTDQEPSPHHDELCRVSIGDAVAFLGKKARAWCWNPLSEQWEKANTARPGAVYLVDVESGGYSDSTGWTREPKDKPTPHRPEKGALPKYAGDPLTFARAWQPLAEHTAQVVGAMDAIAAALALGDPEAATLHTAARWHDVGKAHDEFQKALRAGPHIPPDPTAHYAKSKNLPKSNAFPKERRGFRHELASAITWLLKGPTDAADLDLIAYLIAAHHGKVRLSIRSLPDEQGNPKDPEALFARGVWQDDILPPIPDLIGEPTKLDLGFMRMGESELGPSWLARTVGLRDRVGPLRLAFLETLLRSADARASAMTQPPTNG